MAADHNETEKRSRLSPAKLALLEKRLRGAGDNSLHSRIPRRPKENFLPLSFAQQRLWFLDQLDPANSAYNISVAFRLSGPLDRVALTDAINAVIARHEILRTSFTVVDGDPVQVINATLNCDPPFEDLSELSGLTKQDELLRLATENAKQPFDLTKAPLFRIRVLRLSKTEHALLLTIHHIISDAWSLDIFFREMTLSYVSAFYQPDASAALAELPIQYADFSVWQRNWVEQRGLEQQLAYWRKQLADAPIALDLPTDSPRPQQLSSVGAQRIARFSQALLESLRMLARQEKATLYMVLLAAFNALLFRYTGQGDILVGSPVAGRNRVETEPLIGLFVNTVVLRTDMSGNPSFRELVQQTKENTLSAYAHQDVPFEKLVEELQPPRGVGHSPFFQVILDFKSQVGNKSQREGWQIENLEIDRGAARADLLLFATEEENSLSFQFEYSTDLFESSTVERLLHHFEILLQDVAQNPHHRLSELPLLSDSERHQLLVEWNKTQPSSQRALCIQQLFEEQVARTPEAVAVVFQGQRLTYAALNRRANQLANHLRERGVGPEVLVGLCMNRSIEMVIALLGILKAGGAYVPLDPSYPDDRLSFMLEDAELQVVVTEHALATRFESPAATAICLDLNWDQTAPENDENPDNETAPENAAYVIYTSGSTGRPKGVVVTHHNVVRLFKTAEQAFSFNSDDVWTLFHSSAFDFSVWELWGGLLYGGRVIIVPYLVSRSPEEFYDVLRKEKVTILNQTPSAFRQLIDAGSRETEKETFRLREIVFGGEALDLQILRPWFDIRGDQQPRLVNMYGITETTVHVTFRPLSIKDLQEAGSPIGRPLGDLCAYVLDQSQQLVPIGVPGELYVGGGGLSRGYLNRPDLTAERFVPDKFSQQVGARLYKTGDRVRYRANGELEYLGRTDRQIKIRGFRIELGEIEATLARHLDVAECLVTALEQQSDSGNIQLVAYFVAAGGTIVNGEGLRTFLSSRLPSYMVPAFFVSLDKFTLTPNGKIDRKSLPLPDKSRSDLAGAFIAPRTETEEKIAAVWCEVLARTEISVHENFFDLGGHSLLATQVMSRIRDLFRVSLPLRSLFEKPTIAGLAEVLADAKEEIRNIPPVRPLPR